MGEPTRIAVTVGEHGPVLAPVLQASVSDAEVIVSTVDAPVDDAEVIVSLLDNAARAQLEATLTPAVQWVHVFAAGVDGFPFELLGDRVLTCSRGASAVAIAEFALTTMLAFEKRLPESWIGEPPAQWGQAGLGGLNGRTLVLVGLGAIGTEVAQRALAFGMDVVAVRRTSTPAALDGVEVAGSLTRPSLGPTTSWWPPPRPRDPPPARRRRVRCAEARRARGQRRPRVARRPGRAARRPRQRPRGESVARHRSRATARWARALRAPQRPAEPAHLVELTRHRAPTIEIFVENLTRYRSARNCTAPSTSKPATDHSQRTCVNTPRRTRSTDASSW